MNEIEILPSGGQIEVDDGHIYCGSRCGAGCTRQAFDRCLIEGSALASRMGHGWKLIVWENLGWHCKIQKGVCEIYPSSGHRAITSYQVYFNSIRQTLGKGSTPEEALQCAVDEARAISNELLADIASLKGEPA